MKIRDISIHRLQIPLKVRFEHASAARSKGDSVWVRVESDHGLYGYGEGCPRPYVTGESWETALPFFRSYQEALRNMTSLNDLKSWVNHHNEAIDKNPAVWCAIELALLDLLGKEENKSVEALLDVSELQGGFSYTAILGTAHLEAFKKQVAQYQAMKFKRYKVKVFGKFEEDKQRLDLLHNLLSEHENVRLDGNNVWHTPDEAISFIQKIGHPYEALEEPITHNQYGGLARISAALQTPIILDESFLREAQFQSLEQQEASWIINLRVSKMGGLLRSLAIASEATQRGIPLVVGAQVGESSVLTRAALTIANSFRDNIFAQEGAFGTLLLEKDITPVPLQLGVGGLLNVEGKFGEKSFGLGLPIDHNVIQSLL